MMISFRLPWYALSLGAILFAATYFLRKRGRDPTLRG